MSSTFFPSNEWSRRNSLWCLFFSKFLLKPLKGLIILTNPTVIRGENFELDIRVCCLLSNISLRMFYLGWVPRECYICAYLLREKSSHYKCAKHLGHLAKLTLIKCKYNMNPYDFLFHVVRGNLNLQNEKMILIFGAWLRLSDWLEWIEASTLHHISDSPD